MKISYITTYEAANIHNWSGLGYSIAKMLENQNAEMNYIGNLQIPFEPFFKLQKLAYKKIAGTVFNSNRDIFLAKQYAKQITTRLPLDTDVIFSPGTIPIALLDTKKPKVFYTDATFIEMLNFYDTFSNLCKKTIRHGIYLEKKALESSQLAIYSSDWAAESAIKNYNIPKEKVKVVPFGANLNDSPSIHKVNTIINKRSKKVLTLLFMGVDWHRKGGDLAVEIAQKLNDSGIKTILHVAGIDKLPLEVLPDFIINHGYISKKEKEGAGKIQELFSTCHFLVLPSIADCTPVVYSEANSFGVPCLTTSVGGIPTIVKDGINGMKFKLEANSSEWCEYISDISQNTDKYLALCLSSFSEYQNRLNWNVAGKEIMDLLGKI